MKKIYSFVLAVASITAVHAQLTLTKAFNDPVFGDQFNRKEFDSVGVVPKSTGTNQVWNFSGYTQNANALNTTFTTVATAPNGANYAGATIVEMDGAGANTYYKSTATGYELVGAENPSISYNYTNTAYGWDWPTSYGYTNSDTYAGTCASGANTGVSSGSVTTTASGTGTLILPNGVTLTNVLQLTIVNNFTLSFAGGAFVLNIYAVDYDYFHASQKLPVLTVSYSSANGSPLTGKIRVNDLVLTGIHDLNSDASLSLFPNPAKGSFNVKLANADNESCTVEIMNAMGALVRSMDLGNTSEISENISVSNLAPGMYMVKTSLGNKVSVRKLIVE